MQAFRYILYLSLFLPSLLGANTGPGKPRPANPTWLAEVLTDLEPVGAADFAAPMEDADREAMAAMFAPDLMLSDRSDDIRKVAKLTGELKKEVDKARAILQEVRDVSRQIESLLDAQMTNLPLGIRREFGTTEVFLAIGEARLKATYAEIDLYLGLDLPNTDQDPIFVAKGVKWSRQGGFIGDVEMQLIADWGIDLQAGKSRLILHKTANGTNRGCYAVVTCDGLESAQLDATVLLSRDWVVPVINGVALTDLINNEETNPFANARVHANFTGNFNRDNGFYFETQFGTPFAFTSKEDVHIQVDQVVVDYSSVKNAEAPAMAFPLGYRSNFVDEMGKADVRWQGLYISGVSVTLPEAFSPADRPQLSVGAPQIIIDDTGVSAHLYAAGILPLGEKTVDQWAFSVDSVELKVMHSNFEKASITGMINIPMLAGVANCTENVPAGSPIIEDDCLTYRAIIRPANYYFGISINRDYCIPVFKAGEVVIEENTKIELEYVNQRLSAQAMLFGSINIDARSPDGSASFTMEDLSFDSLILRTQAPYFESGVWDFPRSITAQFKSFELGFEQIYLAKDSVNDNGGRNCQLFFQAYVSVDSALDLDASGAFRLLGELMDTEGGQKWRYRSLKLDAFSIQASTSSFTVGAALAFYGQDEPDPVWGSGFYGYGELTLKALPAGSVGFGAVAQFGVRDNTNYFMVDVMGVFAGAPIPVFGGLNLGAIGGGVYKNMSANTDFLAMDQDGGAELDRLEGLIEAERSAPEPTSSLTGIVGTSLSGKQYTVLPGNLGFYVQLVLVAPNEDAFSITGRLEMEVNTTQGWQASIVASAQAMNPPNYSGNLLIEEGVGIYVEVAVKKNAEVISFEASAEVFINVDGGKIVGINTPLPPHSPDRAQFVSANGFAGGVYLKFSPEEWYFRVGTPTAPLGIRVPVAAAWAYFCVGSNVPPIPPLPDNVTAIVGDMDLSRDMSSMQNASGFAFGAGLEMGAEGNFLIFSYAFNAGIGFDINIRNYGDAVCLDDPNGASIGVNGWYAAGQAWAYVSGSLRVLGSNVASAGLAAVLQVSGPKPTMARGVLAGYYQIGRGRRRSFRLNAQFGEGCTIVGRGGESPFASMEIISGTSINDGATDVNPRAIPEMYTTLPIRELIDLNETDYRLIINENKLLELPQETLVVENMNGTTGEYGFDVQPRDYLKPNTTYRYQAEVLVQKRVNNRWEEEKTEVKAVSFTTGAASPVIDSTNIKAAYPYDGMVNFYVEEYPIGEVQLYRVQPDIMAELTAVWATPSGAVITSQVRVNNQTISYDVPTNLATNSLYKLSLVQHYPRSGGGRTTTPSGGNDQNNGNNQSPGNQIPGTGGSLDAFLQWPGYALFLPEAEERSIYECYFRTSRFQTFEEKVASMTGNVRDRSGSAAPQQVISEQEGWGLDELYEVEGGDDPMVTIAVASENNYPDEYLRTNVLSRFDPVRLGGVVSLGTSENGTQRTVSFDNVNLVYPSEGESIYFTVTDSVNAFTPAISRQLYDQNEYTADISGQAFVFSFSKTIASNLIRFREGVEQIPENAFYLLANTRWPPADPNNPSIPVCAKCMINNGSGLLSGLSDPMARNQMAAQPPYNVLRNYWSDQPANSYEMRECTLVRPIRMVLRDMSALRSFGGYLNAPVSVRFTYSPPAVSPHSVTRNIVVK